MQEDNIKLDIKLGHTKNNNKEIKTRLFIGGNEIDHYIEFTDFITASKDNRDDYTKSYEPQCKQLEYSSFFPVSCSCGIASCDGIYDGVYTKYRKYSVEWRIPKNMGYESIFDKTFYSFHKKQYLYMIETIKQFLIDNKDVLIETENVYGCADTITIGECYKWLDEYK